MKPTWQLAFADSDARQVPDDNPGGAPRTPVENLFLDVGPDIPAAIYPGGADRNGRAQTGLL